MQKIGQGRDAARKRAGAEVRKPALSRVRRGFARSVCKFAGLAFALRRDGTAGGEMAEIYVLRALDGEIFFASGGAARRGAREGLLSMSARSAAPF